MKAEHRHELKTNELAQWLMDLPEWTKQNYKTIIYVAAVIVLAAGSAIWHRYKTTVVADRKAFELTSALTSLPLQKMEILQSQVRGIDRSYILIQTADNFETIAQTATSDEMAAFALIKKGDTLRMELHFRPGNVNERDIASAVEKAKTAYNQALTKTQNPLFTAKAKMALGLCEEELGNFDNARKIYDEIASDPELDGTPAKAEANMRLLTMQDYTKKPFIAPSPEAAPLEIPRPQIELPPVDLDLPTP